VLEFRQCRRNDRVLIDPEAVALVVERERMTSDGPQKFAVVVLHCGTCIHLVDDERVVGIRIAAAKTPQA